MPGDAEFNQVNAALFGLEKARDAVAGQIKNELNDAEFSGTPVFAAGLQLGTCEGIIAGARLLAQSISSS